MLVGTGGGPLFDVSSSDPEAGYFAKAMGVDGAAKTHRGLLAVAARAGETASEQIALDGDLVHAYHEHRCLAPQEGPSGVPGQAWRALARQGRGRGWTTER
jgi:hypothetical protein